jgi:hypothetical protein
MGGVGDPLDIPYRGGVSRPSVRLGAIGEGWGLLQDQWGVWILATGLALLCHAGVLGLASSVFDIDVPDGLGGFRMSLPSGGGAVAMALTLAVNGFFLGGMMRMACRQVRGRKVTVGDLFSVVDVLPNLILGALIYGLASMVGFMCLFVPGLIVLAVFMFTFPLIVDGGLGATEAMGRSWEALSGQLVSATLFHIVVSLVAGVGSCLCCVGLLLTAPLYSLSIAVLYRDFFLTKGATFAGKPEAPSTDF